MACGWSYAFTHKIKSLVSRGQSGPGAVWLEAGGTFLTSSLRGIRMQEGEGAYLLILFRGLGGRDHMINGVFSVMFLNLIWKMAILWGIKWLEWVVFRWWWRWHVQNKYVLKQVLTLLHGLTLTHMQILVRTHILVYRCEDTMHNPAPY